VTALGEQTGKDVVFGPQRGQGSGLRFFSITHDMLGDPFWAVYRRGLNDAAVTHRCEVHHLAPERFSPAEMVGLLEHAVDASPDGILATVPDASIVEGPLRRAVKAGTPVIAVNAADPRPAGERIPYQLYIGADDFAGGRTAARRLLELATPTRALLVDHYMSDNACHVRRWQGFVQGMREAGIEPQRLRVPGEHHRGAVAAIAEALAGNATTAVCTLGPPGAALVIEAVKQRPLQHLTVHGSFDLATAQLDAIAAGALAFTIDSQQYLQGYLGITLLALHAAHGLSLAGDILTGPVIVDRENAAQVRVQAEEQLR
jgi:simple sugar transport system substrate-binding protein